MSSLCVWAELYLNKKAEVFLAHHGVEQPPILCKHNYKYNYIHKYKYNSKHKHDYTNYEVEQLYLQQTQWKIPNNKDI